MARQRSGVEPARASALALLALTLLAAGGARAQAFGPEIALGGDGKRAPDLFHAGVQVAFDGENFVLAWLDGRNAGSGPHGYPLIVRRLTAGGEALDGNGLTAIARTGGGNTGFRLAGAPWGSLLVQSNDSSSLIVIGPTKPPPPGIRMVRIDRDGRLLDPVPRSIEQGRVDWPNVSCTNSDCLVTWSMPEGGTRGLALDACGEPVLGTELVLGQAIQHAAVGGNVHLLLGSEKRSQAKEPAIALGVSRDGKSLWGPTPIPGLATDSMRTPHKTGVAFGATRFLIVWSEHDGQQAALKALSIGAAGDVDPEPSLLAEGPFPLLFSELTWEGAAFRVALSGVEGLRTLAVNERAQVLGPASELAASGVCVPQSPAIARGTEHTLMAWNWIGPPAQCPEVPAAAALLAPDGTVIGNSIRFVDTAPAIRAPELASGGDDYLAAWYENRAGAPGIYTRLLALDGTPLEPAQLTLPGTSARFVQVTESGYRLGSNTHVRRFDAARRTWSAAEPCAVGAAVPGFELWPIREPGQAGEDLPRTMRLTLFTIDECGGLSAEPVWQHGSPDYHVDDDVHSVFDGANYAFVWHTRDAFDGSRSGILFQQFDGSGVPALHEPLILRAGNDERPRGLIGGGERKLLLIEDAERKLRALRLAADGTPLDPEPVLVASDVSGEVTGAFDGESFVIVWQAHDDGQNLQLGRVSAETATVSEPVLVANSVADELDPELVAAGAGRSLLAYARFEPAQEISAIRSFVRAIGAGPCRSLAACSAGACDPCCVRDCGEIPPAFECSPRSCQAGCEPGSRCAGDLGCISDPPAAKARATSVGCGCRQAPSSGAESLWALAAAGLALTRARRRARHSLSAGRGRARPLRAGSRTSWCRGSGKR